MEKALQRFRRELSMNVSKLVPKKIVRFQFLYNLIQSSSYLKLYLQNLSNLISNHSQICQIILASFRYFENVRGQAKKTNFYISDH